MSKKPPKSAGGNKDGSNPPPATVNTIASPAREIQLWTAKCEVSEQARKEHQRNAALLVHENDRLQDLLSAAERDMLDVITYLKTEAEQKEQQLSDVVVGLKEELRRARTEREQTLEHHQRVVTDLETAASQRDAEIRQLRTSLEALKEFSKQRTKLEHEIVDAKGTIQAKTILHEQETEKLSDKFFQEKMRMQADLDQRLHAAAKSAHTDALSNVDDSVMELFQEKSRLAEELRIIAAENDRLKKSGDMLTKEVASLKQSIEENNLVAHDSALRFKASEKKAKGLDEKVSLLEATLSHTIREFEHERSLMNSKFEDELHAINEELLSTRGMLLLKAAETKRIRALARKVLDQRQETEQFFLSSLQEVKAQIVAQRAQFRKAAVGVYQMQLREGLQTGVLPHVRTFTKTTTSTIQSQGRTTKRPSWRKTFLLWTSRK